MSDMMDDAFTGLVVAYAGLAWFLGVLYAGGAL